MATGDTRTSPCSQNNELIPNEHNMIIGDCGIQKNSHNNNNNNNNKHMCFCCVVVEGMKCKARRGVHTSACRQS